MYDLIVSIKKVSTSTATLNKLKSTVIRSTKLPLLLGSSQFDIP